MSEPLSQSSDPKFVVTLVHGTWARKASWVTDNSNLRQVLREKLGPDTVIKNFEWSGRNTHSARKQAIKELGEKLKKRINKYPHSKHHIVSHSHGGNIALLAVVDAELNEQIDGIVCMSTPFISARQRDLGSDAIGQFSGALVALVFLMYWLMDRIPFPDFGIGIPRWVIELGLGSLIVIALLYSAVRWHGFSKKIYESLNMSSDARQKVLSDHSFREKVFIIRTPADEASATLSLSQFLCQISVRFCLKVYAVYLYVYRSIETIKKHKPIICNLVGLAVVLILVLLALLNYVAWPLEWQTQLNSYIPIAIAFLSSVIVLSLVIAFVSAEYLTVFLKLLASAVLWPVVFILSLLLLPFGWEIALANVILDVTAETTPPGSWRVYLVEPNSRTDGQESIPLMHSVV